MSRPDDRVPTLVQYCQRVAAIHVDAISSLGDEFRYDLVKPILERCTVDQLLRLEQGSPYLTKETPEIWKNLSLQRYPLAAERYNRGDLEEPESWKTQYFVLVEEEAQRIEQAGIKIRRQRQEAEDRKKEQEIKLTTQLPPAKRRWGVPVQPKTLFQKTRSEASRIRKSIFAPPMLPPMPSGGKNYRVLAAGKPDLLPPPPSGMVSPRVTVTTVVHRVPATGAFPPRLAVKRQSSHKSVPPLPSSSASSPSSPSRGNSSGLTSASKLPLSSSSSVSSLTSLSSMSTQSSTQPPLKKPRTAEYPHITSESRPSRSPIKRDPMASLFLPKHRAYSQRIK
ncbi:RNA polymerase II transcription factor SIII subunit A-domain-containing protein [Mycena alexandri]|uniref:RNA polymerase II transcription factor SIII subunit A-domain-containing protein n=1 Tax=Mycena alexandri TaxID=1745969 RepID=A0AAD6XGE2_9AGAR|nr:RNA polymerase II transcription factor SIII subunit A-domain-containing protein [Mycena alexandri]